MRLMQVTTRKLNIDSNIQMTRRLPVPGEVKVSRGQRVNADDIIAVGEAPDSFHVIHVARQLGRPTIDMDAVMLKEVGEYVDANEVIASIKGFFGGQVRSPVEGQIAALGPGWVLIETEAEEFELEAFVRGVVSQILPRYGAVIDTVGVMVEAACGFGGETYGILRRLVNAPYELIDASYLDESVQHTVLLAGRTVDEDLLRAADEYEVRAFVVGSIDASLLTLDPPVEVAVVATEGFGNVAMSPTAFGALGTLDGKRVSARGVTPKNAYRTDEQQRPLVVSATSTGKEISAAVSAKSPINAEAPPLPDLTIGTRVRVVRGQWLGASGSIASIPDEPLISESGLTVPGALVSIDGTPHFVPWSNMEQII